MNKDKVRGALPKGYEGKYTHGLGKLPKDIMADNEKINNELTWLAAETSVYGKSIKSEKLEDAKIMANCIIVRVCKIQSLIDPNSAYVCFPGASGKDD